MKNVVLRRNYCFSLSLAMLASTWLGAIAFPTKASADESCRALLTDLNNYLKASSDNIVIVSHLTNYQENGLSGLRFVGYGFGGLSRLPSGDLVGSSNRFFSTRISKTGQPFDPNQPVQTSYFIDLQETTIVFNGQDGPYNLTCLGDKFAIVNYLGNSLESFAFKKDTKD